MKMLEPEFLESDEVAHELQIRSMTSEDHRKNTKNLRARIVSEMSGEESLPKWVDSEPYTEFNVCNEKFTQMNMGVKKCLEDRDLLAIRLYRTRMLHVQGRLNRLATHKDDFDGFQNLMSRVNEYVKKLDEFPGHDQTPLREDEGATGGTMTQLLSPPTPQFNNIFTPSNTPVNTSNKSEKLDNVRRLEEKRRKQERESIVDLARQTQELRKLFESKTNANENDEEIECVDDWESKNNEEANQNLLTLNALRQEIEQLKKKIEDCNADQNKSPPQGPMPKKSEFDQAQPNILQNAPHTTQSFSNNNTLNEMYRNQIYFPQDFYRKPWPEDLTFCGSSDKRTAFRFIKEVRSYAMATRMSDDRLFENVYHFLRKQARDWYSTVCDSIYTWRSFQEAFLKRYSDIESDTTLRRKIMERKQGEDESFKDFVDELRNLFACRQSNDYTKHSMMDVIKDNMHPSLKLLCATTIPFMNNLDELVEYVGEVDAQRRACMKDTKIFVGQVSNSQNSQPSLNNYNPKNFYNQKFKKDFVKNESKNDTFPNDKVTCFNCGIFGHRFRMCRKPKTMFCEWCGKKNVQTKYCPECKSKNAKRS